MSAAYVRSPALRGSVLAFAAEDDVWVARLPEVAGDGSGDGSAVRAWRLSDDRVPVKDVALSPDGAHVAWVSVLDGEPEVRVAPAGGGPARRLTWWGDATTRVLGWSPDGRVVAASAVGEPFRSRTWAWALPLGDQRPERLPYGPVSGIAWSSTGALALATGRGGRPEYSWWKRYRGGTASRLWVNPAGDDADGLEPLRVAGGGGGAPLDGQVVRPMWVGDRLAFLSDHEGHGNVYSCLADGSDLRRHTDHEGFYARHAASDGQRVVHVHGGDLWVLDGLAADSVARRLDVDVAGPASARAPRPLTIDEVRSGLDAVSVDATGRSSLVGVRGAVHRLTHRGGPAPVVAAEPGVRTRLPVALRGGAAWVSDAGGRDAVVVTDAGGGQRRLAEGRLGRVLDLAASPDGRWLAAATHDGRVVLLGLEGAEAPSGERTVATVTADAAQGLTFSPDSRWLAWSAAQAPEQLSSVFLARVEPPDAADEPADGGAPAGNTAAQVVAVTPVRFGDTEPTFTRDGKHLALFSRRTFDPVYDEHVFELSFPVATRPFLVPLAAGTAPPSAPELDGAPASAPVADGSAGASQAPGAPAPGAPSAAHADVSDLAAALVDGIAEVVVDVDHLADRLVPAPVPAGRLTSLHAVAGGASGGLVWLRHPLGGATGESQPDAAAAGTGPAPRPVLERLDLATGTTVVLREGVDAVWVSGDGQRLVVRDGEALRVLPAAAPVPEGDASGAVVDVDLERLRVHLDPVAEWTQMFDEAVRLMAENFWAPDMAGVDWDAVAQRYRPLVARVATPDDLVDLLWETQAELGTSHAYVMPPADTARDARRLGFLGADLERGDDGTWQVSRVLPGESSDGRARSPLAAPGVAARGGDVVVSVDGVPVDPDLGPAPALVGAAQRPVALELERGGVRRTVVVVPLADERPLRYQDAVAARRAAVTAASGGRAGYLHVPDMMGQGWAQLHRDLRTEVRRDALVLDVRDNSGGHTSQLVVERVAREVLGWDLGRGWPAGTYPADARRGPMVAITDENAGSDGDIVTAALKARGLAPVVGARSWGGVVGIDGRYSLVDGTGVTQPRYAFWFPGLGWSVENHGVDPDVEVPFPPAAWARGTDPQLDAALALVLGELDRVGAAAPPDVSTRPPRTPPTLGARP